MTLVTPKRNIDRSNRKWNPSKSRSSGFTLVELLVVMAIIGVLAALFLPAVQQARESARMAQCKNHLKQIALSFLNHESSQMFLPTGGWGYFWIGSPDLGYDENQPGGWFYNVLEYLDNSNLRMLGGTPDLNLQRLQTTSPIFNCPSRRSGLFPYTSLTGTHEVTIPPSGNQTPVAKSDYAANAGDQQYEQYFPGPPDRATGLSPNYPWPSTTALTGISFQRSKIALRDIIDGTSTTFMAGEKYMNVDEYYNGQSGSDNESAYNGFDNDLFRGASSPPLKDSYGQDDGPLFGSAHAGGFNMALCDGSVRPIQYSIDLKVYQRLANRQDGLAVGEF